MGDTREIGGPGPVALLSSRGVFLFVCLFVLIFSFFFVLGPHLRHMEVPRLGVESEL